MNKYEQYKPSGVEWLGEVPRHWEVKKTKFNFDFSKGLTITKENLVDDGIACVNYGEIHSKFGFEVNTEIHNLKCVPSEYLEHSQFALLKKGDFVFADTSEDVKGSGNFTYLSSDTPTFAGYHTVIARLFQKHHPRFLAYVFHSEPFRNQIRTQIKGVKVFSITQAILKNTFIWYPSYKEQSTIAAFLDERTTYIDRLIAKQQALSEKLSEKRTALITEAVCGRVKISPNPSLQKRGTGSSGNSVQAANFHETAPLFSKEGLGEICFKDSGIQWLGKVPRHWEVLSIKRLTQVKRGASPRPIDDPKYFNDDGEYAWVRIADVTASEDYLLETTQRLSDLGSSLSVKMEPDSLFLSIAGTVGKPIITKIKCCIHDGFVYFPDWTQSVRFLYYIFASGQPYLGLGKLGTQLNLNTDTVGNIKIALPPLEEQTTITTFLDIETAKIDRLQTKIAESIARLKEYRAALITQVVTGKVRINAT